MEQWTGRGDLLRARRWKKKALDVASGWKVDGKEILLAWRIIIRKRC